MFVLKWASYAAAAAYILRNIDILALLGAMCGSFLHICGVEKSGAWIKLILGVYLLVKLFQGVL